MTENDFQLIWNAILKGITNKKEYVQLCKNSWDFDNCKGLKKSEAQEVKKEYALDFKLAGREKMFFKDYYFGKLQLRFMIPYGHGMVDCSYRVFSGMTDNSFPTFSFRRIVQSITEDIENPEYTFPMNSSIEEFRKHLKFILNLNDQILQIIERETSQVN